MTQKRFAVFDIDGTLIRWQLYHAVADALAKRGHIDAKTYDALRHARMKWKIRAHPQAFKSYERELVKVHEQALLQLSHEQFEEAASAVFNEYKNQTYTYTRDLLKALKKQGFLLFAISGSQIEIVSRIAEHFGFDDCVGTEYLYKDGKYTGESVYHAGDKSKVLKELADKHRVAFAGSIGIGDSPGDIPMLELVEQAIAFNPDQALFKEAKKQGWKVVIERKNVVYELEAKNGKYILVKAG